MNLADKRLVELGDPSFTNKKRILLRCHVAADLIHNGQYEAAREALGDLWRGLGQRPHVEGLEEETAAEVLRQAGALSGWLGSSQQAEGAQEAAKDLISEGAALFEQVGNRQEAALARSDLALCYWREGAYDEARVLLTKAFEVVEDAEQRAKVLLRLTTVEYWAGRYGDALNILKGHAHLFDEGVSHVLRGSFHNHLALVFRRLGAVENRADYFDRAIIEYTAAIYHYEEAGHERYGATNENNLAYLLYKLGRFEEAHEHLDRACGTLSRLGDAGLLAQAEETRARVLVAQQKYLEANRVISGVLRTFEKGGESALLADALTTQGVVWARQEAFEASINILRHAVNVAERAGALSNAGLAALTLIEEHGERRLPDSDLYEFYCLADDLLRGTQDVEGLARLRQCARTVVRRLSGARIDEEGFALPSVVHEYEAKFIERALEGAQGSVTGAAKMLGMSHQTLANALNTRHRQLLQLRTPAKRRGRSLIKRR